MHERGSVTPSSTHVPRALDDLRAISLLLCSALSLLQPAHAQRTSGLGHQSWSVTEGLPQNSVHSILQSSDGFLWVATESGVARFDGVTFRVFQHSSQAAFTSDDTCCIVEDRQRALWFGTADGLVRLEGGTFQHVGQEAGLPSATVLALSTAGNGWLTVLTSSGLVQLVGDRFVPLSSLSAFPPAQVTALGRSAANDLLLLTGRSVLRVQAGRLSTLPLTLPEHVSTLQGAVPGPDGALWLRSADGVVVVTPSGERVWRAGTDLPGGHVESLVVDRKGTAWVGTNDGLVTLRATAQAVQSVAALETNAVLSLFEDQEGNVWVGTEASGLHILRQLKFQSVPALADRALTAVVQASDGALWVGTREDGLRRLQNGTLSEPASGRDLTSPVVLSLAPGLAGSAWVGTPDGLNHVAANGAVERFTSADGLPDDDVRSLLADPDRTVWIGTRRGLVHLRGHTAETLTRASGLGGDLIGTLLRTPASTGPDAAPAGLWVSTSGGLTLVQSNASRTFTEADGLPGPIVVGLAQEASGALWAASPEGALSRLAGDGRFHAVTGMPGGQTITAIATDTHGFLWLRDARGVRRAALSSLALCIDAPPGCRPALETFGIADGLPSEEAVPGGSPPLALTTTGELWFATRRGLAVANTAALPVNSVPPPVSVEQFLVDDQALAPSPQPLVLPFGHSRFTMEYAGLSYAAPSRVRYRFRLDGFDREWTDAGTRRSATYTNLPPGSYRFRVAASNNDGVWSTRDAELPFRIVPPFYRRWWFALLLLLAASSLVYAGYQLRLRSVQRQFTAVLRERNRIAREIHDTLAQDFVGVSIQLEIVTQLLGLQKVGAALQQLERTRTLVRDGLADARESIWELRANTAESSLPTRLARLVERYGSGATEVRVAIGGAFRPLETSLENAVLRIAQEALSNVERHAVATEVLVDLQYGPDTLTLTITDNGRGFATEPAAQLQDHYGLRGMRERTTELRGTLDVQSAPGTGTGITVQIPIDAAER